MIYHVNIGSNLGNTRLNLARAMKVLGEVFGPYEVSHSVESAPWGFVSRNRFLNIGLNFESDLSPREVLEKLQGIEKELGGGSHRGADGKYCDRRLDIDIVATDGPAVKEEGLRIPHPHLAERDFFLKPLAELMPEWKDSVTGLTAAGMLERLEGKEKD